MKADNENSPQVTSGNVSDLITSGRNNRKKGSHAQALKDFTAAATAAPGNPIAQFEIGYSLCDLNRIAEAERYFHAALEIAPDCTPALAGLARLAMQRREPAAALPYLTQASSLEPRNISLRVQMTRALQQLGRLDEAETLAKAVLEEVPGNGGCLEALGDIANSRNDPQGAQSWYEKALAVDPRSPSAQYKAAKGLHDAGRNEEAESRYLALLDQVPEHMGALYGLNGLARSTGKLQLALDRLQAAANIGPFKLPIQHRIAELLREMQRFDEAEVVYRAIIKAVPGDVTALLGLGTIERKKENFEVSLAHFQAAFSKAPEDAKVGMQVVNALRALCRFEEAGALVAKLEGFANVDDADRHLWRFEHLCQTMQLAEAEKCLQEWQGHKNLPRAAVVRTAQLYAALGRWSRILDLLRERVIQDEWTEAYNYLLEPLARAARGTGRYPDACEILDLLPSRHTNEAIREARDQLVEEMRLIASLSPEFERICANVDTTIRSPLRTMRADLFGKVVSSATPKRPSVRIYMCTDANYLLGASVCMFTLLKYNRPSLTNCELMVFCDDDVVDLGSDVFAQLGTAFGIEIDVRASSTLLSKDLEFRTDWGVFNPGRSLSQAAYYRIYAARQMLSEGVTGRALYIDSDTCVFGGVDQFFGIHLQGMPLGACLDDKQKPSIRRAASLLDVDPDRYFNSGILLFELEHPKLLASLDHSIKFALTEPEKLSFVDQCALNKAFKGKFTTLPARFNMFVSPYTPTEELPVEPLVEHFISQPKPWDPLYPSNNGDPWLREFADFGRIVSADLIRRKLALQYRGALGAVHVPAPIPVAKVVTRVAKSARPKERSKPGKTKKKAARPVRA